MRTRNADESDLSTVYKLYMAALQEIKEYVLQPDAEKCAGVVARAFYSAPCVLIELNGEIIGFAGLQRVTPAYSNEKHLEEYMFYIKPEHRSLKAAKALSDGAKAVANEQQLPLYMRHMVKTSDVSNKEKFLRRWGYRPDALLVRYEGGK